MFMNLKFSMSFIISNIYIYFLIYYFYKKQVRAFLSNEKKTWHDKWKRWANGQQQNNIR